MAELAATSGIFVDFGDPPDVFEINERQTIGMIRAGLLEPIGRRASRDGIDLDDFPQVLIDRFRASDAVYAIPCAMQSQVLHYRRDLLGRYAVGIPTRWDELGEVARRIQRSLRSDGIPDLVGLAAAGVAGDDENFHFLGESLFPSWGWRWNRGAGHPPRIYQEETVEALNWFVELVDDAGVPDAGQHTRSEARRLFCDGRAAFLIDSPAAVNCARMDDIETNEMEFGMAVVPAGPKGRPEPGLSATVLCIRRSSSVIEESWEVIKALISPESSELDGIGPSQIEPLRETALNSAAFAASAQAGVLRTTRAYARINRPMIEGGDDFGDIAGAAAEAAISGVQGPDEALRVAQLMIDGMQWR